MAQYRGHSAGAFAAGRPGGKEGSALEAEKLRELSSAMAELNEMRALTLALELVQAEASPVAIFGALLEGFRQVEARCDEGKYYIGDLLMASHVLRSVMDTALACPDSEEAGSMGRVLCCTVRGDIHDLGKRVVREVLKYNGFEVSDLGVDVSPERVAAAVEEVRPQILVLSGTLRKSVLAIRETIRVLEKRGLRQDLFILVGGRSVQDVGARLLGADGKSETALDSLRLCHEFMALRAGGAR